MDWPRMMDIIFGGIVEEALTNESSLELISCLCSGSEVGGMSGWMRACRRRLRQS